MLERKPFLKAKSAFLIVFVFRTSAFQAKRIPTLAMPSAMQLFRYLTYDTRHTRLKGSR